MCTCVILLFQIVQINRDIISQIQQFAVPVLLSCSVELTTLRDCLIDGIEIVQDQVLFDV